MVESAAAGAALRTEYLVHRPLFASRPDGSVVAKFKAWNAETGEPERFPDISTTKPPADGLTKLSDFSINLGVRPGGEAAPCPICRPHDPQYIHGMLVWCASTKAIYAIGRDCGRRHFGDEAFDAATLQKQREDRQREFEDYCLANIPRVPDMRAWLVSVADRAAEVDALSRGFRRDAKEVYRRLRSAVASGDTLTVSKPLEPGAKKPETISVSQVIGRQFLVGEPDLTRRIRIEEQRLSAIDWGRDNDEVFLALASVPAGQVTKLKTFHQDAARGLAAIYARMQAAHQFLSAENVIALDRWGQHELCEFHFRAQRAQVSITVSSGVKSGYDWYAKIRFNEPVTPPP